MITRRGLLLGVVASAGGVLLARCGARLTSTSGALVGKRNSNFKHWVIDSSIDPYGEIFAAASRAGQRVTRFDRDIGDVAMRIEADWLQERRPVAGLTLPSGAFVLESLALRHGMEMALTVDHRYRGGHWTHELSAPMADANDVRRALLGRAWRLASVAALSRSIDQVTSPTRRAPRMVVRNANAEIWNGPARYISWSLQPIATARVGFNTMRRSSV